jgi:hypothetical protein
MDCVGGFVTVDVTPLFELEKKTFEPPTATSCPLDTTHSAAVFVSCNVVP